MWSANPVASVRGPPLTRGLWIVTRAAKWPESTVETSPREPQDMGHHEGDRGDMTQEESGPRQGS